MRVSRAFREGGRKSLPAAQTLRRRKIRFSPKTPEMSSIPLSNERIVVAPRAQTSTRVAGDGIELNSAATSASGTISVETTEG